jgi:O-methyltransferase
MSQGAVCLLADYHDPVKTNRGTDSNPGVKWACDEFFSGRMEKVSALYGNHYSHGFFRRNKH